MDIGKIKEAVAYYREGKGVGGPHLRILLDTATTVVEASAGWPEKKNLDVESIYHVVKKFASGEWIEEIDREQLVEAFAKNITDNLTRGVANTFVDINNWANALVNIVYKFKKSR
jgi:hypothetical protein